MLINQLKNFSDEGIFYCIWKNIQNYFDESSDPLDLDIYIYPEHSKKAFQLLKKNGWVRVVNPVAEYKSIRHYLLFKLDRTYHLHIYIGLRTGDSWLKNYYFPFDKFIMNNAIKDNNEIIILSKSSYYIIFMIRMIIKNSTLIGRYLYKYSKEKYIKENIYFDNEIIDINQLDKLDIEIRNFYDLIYTKQIDHKAIPNILDSKKISKNFDKFSLINTRTIFLRQIFSLIIRLSNKLVFRLKKLPFNKGNIIVLYGTDGCGKSSLVNSITKCLSKFLPTQKAHLGKPFSNVRFFNYFLYQRENINHKSRQEVNPNLILRVFRTTALSIMRLISSYIQVIKSSIGITVISDRWPSEPGSPVDGPIIYNSDKNNLIINIFNYINVLIYKMIPKADLAIFLKVELSEIIKRNSKRNKPEDEEFIKKRFNDTISVNIKANKKIKYFNSKDLSSATNDCLKLISLYMEN